MEAVGNTPGDGQDAPAPVVEQQREVTGTDLSFIECVSQDVLPQPTLMSFNEWQVWRKSNRPSKANDGLATTSKQEARLWRSVMANYHTSNWAELLAVRMAEAADDVAEDEVAADAAVTGGGSPTADTREERRPRLWRAAIPSLVALCQPR